MEKRNWNSNGNSTNKSSIIQKVKFNFSGWTLIIPTLVLFIIIVWRPIIIGIVYSFFKLKGFAPAEFVGFKNYIQVLTDTNFLQTLWNTIGYVFWSLVIGLPVPFIAAVMLNEMLHGQGYFKFTTYLPVVIPSVATCLIWRMIYMDGNGGLLNMILYNFGISPMNWLSNKSIAIILIIIAMTWNGFGGALIMYLASLQSVDKSLYEATRIDGAGFWRRIHHVLMPRMKGILLLLAVRQIIGVFQVTEQPLVMTGGGPNGATMTIGLTNYFYAFKYGYMDKSLALGVVTFILLVGLTLVYFKLDKKIND